MCFLAVNSTVQLCFITDQEEMRGGRSMAVPDGWVRKAYPRGQTCQAPVVGWGFHTRSWSPLPVHLARPALFLPLRHCPASGFALGAAEDGISKFKLSPENGQGNPKGLSWLMGEAWDSFSQADLWRAPLTLGSFHGKLTTEPLSCHAPHDQAFPVEKPVSPPASLTAAGMGPETL